VGLAGELAREQRLALARGQAPDLGDEPAQRVAPGDLLGGARRERHRDRHDVVEAVRALGPAQLVDRAVADDHVEPRAERDPAVRRVQSEVRAHERVLDDVLGLVAAAAEDPAGEREQRRPVARVDLGEGPRVAGAHAEDKGVVGEVRERRRRRPAVFGTFCLHRGAFRGCAPWA
jgi:hypothetical protein